ncbi:MAG: nucleoside-diphosphate kinase [Spirochaetaceae bacterium]|jgi:nucleoside diphosphate kinase|nr:nucleoside-diphosphate kinase [Spirochaetaceae bacterium]
MEQAISYVMVTPYTIAKSRTGGVLARLLSQLDLELVGAQMIAPDEVFIREYAASLREENTARTVSLLADYVEQHLAPSGGRKHRTLLLLFRGENPCGKLAAICGHIYPEHQNDDSLSGETIRDTYADLIVSPEDPQAVTYFEPAVMTPRTQEWADKDLALFTRFLPGKKNIIKNIQYPDPSKIEQTLVIIKPDNWRYASSKPGTIIDMFSRTGLRIVGIKVHRFSLAEALEFYGPVERALKEKLSPSFGKKARELLEKEFEVTLNGELEKCLTDSFGIACARDQFAQIIEFMSGTRPEKCPPEDINTPGSVKCMIIIYEGENAVKKIREVLGPTDPLKAPGGTIRREFGSNVMVNTAHASDSPENVEREMEIVRINENSLEGIIRSYLALRH